MSQRFGKSRIASIKVSLANGSTHCLLVASSFDKKKIAGISKIFRDQLKNQTNVYIFAKIFDVLEPVTIFAQSSILDV